MHRKLGQLIGFNICMEDFESILRNKVKNYHKNLLCFDFEFQSSIHIFGRGGRNLHNVSVFFPLELPFVLNGNF